MHKRKYLPITARTVFSVMIVCLMIIIAGTVNRGGATEAFAGTPTDLEETVGEATEEDEGTGPAVKESGYAAPPYLTELMTDNPNVRGWLECDLLSSGYPIMWNSDDNDYYCYHDINGCYSTAGSIYLDANHDISAEGLHTIYGHRRKDGTMFRPMADMVYKETFSSHPYAVIYTDEKEIKLEAVAAYAGTPDGSYRSIIKNDPEALSDFLYEKTGIREDVENLFVMVTCSYGWDGRQDERTYVIYRETGCQRPAGF